MSSANIEKTTLKELRFYDGNKYQPPFDPELDAMDGVTDDEMTWRFQMAVKLADLEKQIKRVPVARYDEETDRAYLEYADGRRVYAN